MRVEDENGKLKRIVADLTLDNTVLERPAVKKLLTPAGKRAAAAHARQQHGLSERHACRLISLARSTQRRKLKAKADEELRSRLGQLARERQRFGYRRLTALLRREGGNVNHKKIYRIYRTMGLAMRVTATATARGG